jgi:type I site-specific restriction-modification system R (restriction) subunit
MKKWFVLVIMAAVIFSVSSVGIGEEKKDADKPAIKKKPRGATGSQADELRERVRQGRDRKPRSQEDRMKRLQMQQADQLRRTQEAPKALIQNLNAIKKLAEKEKATETVAALEKLIAKTQKKMDKKVQGINERQAKYQEMMEKRGKRGVVPPKPGDQPKKNKRGKNKPAKEKTDKD